MKQFHKNLRLPRRYATRNDLSHEIATLRLQQWIAMLRSQQRIAALPMVAVNDTGSRNFGGMPNSKTYLLKTFLREGT
jgi:hypothetical protein